MKINRAPYYLGLSLLLGTFPGCAVPDADGPADTFGLDFSMPEGSRTGGAIVFCVDGLTARIFDQMLQGGELPAIKKYFVDRGLYCPQATTNVPSLTLANLVSIVTGRLPGHHGVIGNNWFDRNRLVWRDYGNLAQKNALDRDYTDPTIYEQFHDQITFSVFYQPHRGATKFIENWASAGPPFLLGYFQYVDRLALYRFHIVMDIARQYRQFPAVTTVYQLAPDFRAYRHGLNSKEYRDAIKHTDRQIGRVLGDLARAGLLDKTVLVLISDHGLCQVDRHLDLKEFLRRDVGLAVGTNHWWENDPFEERLDDYRKFSTILFGSGDRYWALCLRKPIRDANGALVGFDPWNIRPSIKDLENYPAGCWYGSGKWQSKAPNEKAGVNLPKVLVEHEAVDAIACLAGTGRARVLRKTGQVEFRQEAGRGGKISYHLVSGKDPLGWEGKVPADMLNGKPAEGREWLKATLGTDFPDLPEQILAYFRAPKAGDVVLFAAPGWDFGTVNHAGHGGLRSEEMIVPLILAGPGVPQGRIQSARVVDLMPTLLKLLNRPVPPNLDGQSLLPE